MPTFVAAMLRILDETGTPYEEDIIKIITPLGMSGTGYLPSGEGIAPNRIADESAQHEAGYPLDGNARFLHGIAGHAGLFTTIADSSKYLLITSRPAACSTPLPLPRGLDAGRLP